MNDLLVFVDGSQAGGRGQVVALRQQTDDVVRNTCTTGGQQVAQHQRRGQIEVGWRQGFNRVNQLGQDAGVGRITGHTARAGHGQGTCDEHVGNLRRLTLQCQSFGERGTGAAGGLGDGIDIEQVHRAGDAQGGLDGLHGLLNGDVQATVLFHVGLHQGGQRVDHRGRGGSLELDVEGQAGGDVGAACSHDFGGVGQQRLFKLVLAVAVGGGGRDHYFLAIDHAIELDCGAADIAIGHDAHGVKHSFGGH